jgi:hypothetical protein
MTAGNPTATTLCRVGIASLVFAASAFAAPPRYDHVVVVIEENRTFGQVVGDTVNAPYITSLANGGVSFNSIFAETHPSQPNYLHLFSGSNQGITTDSLIVGYPFTTPNLGAELIAAGFTFRGYCEGLRAVGDADYDPHTATDPGVKYRRRHNPWANWQGAGANQLPANTNSIFANFPADFTQLPTVSFVVPDLDHDMHDGSRKQGDDWLLANLGAYATWAPSHNSLLIVTWDEDDYNETNRIPTVFYGANLKNGRTSAPTWTHHNLLRTLEDMYGAAHASRAALVQPITGIFAGEPTPVVTTFRQGLNGYLGCRDTFITADQPAASFAAAQDLSVDGDYGAGAGAQPAQALVRFDNLFGNTAGLVPPNAIILSAKLILRTSAGASDDSLDRVAIHRMIADWTGASTWNSLTGGVATDGIEALGAATFSKHPDVPDVPAIFDVTADVEAWRTGVANRGWVLTPDTVGGTDGWLFKSLEFATDATFRPTLEIAYTLPATAFQTWATESSLAGAEAGATADTDRDGSNHIIEFAFNMNPLRTDGALATGSGTSGLPIARMTGSGPTRRLQLEFIRRKAATGSGLTYEAQFGSDLATFTTAPTADSVTSIDATWERVVISDPVMGAGQRFGRVKLTLF